MPKFGKTRPLTEEHFEEFESLFGEAPTGDAPRKESAGDRWRSFSRKEISDRDDNLDIVWLNANDADDDSGPQDLAATILFQLQSAAGEIEALVEEFSTEEERS